jgi:hypothetical protein
MTHTHTHTFTHTHTHIYNAPDRDYVFYRRVQTGENGQKYMISKAIRSGKYVPLAADAVRIDRFWTRLALEETQVCWCESERAFVTLQTHEPA